MSSQPSIQVAEQIALNVIESRLWNTSAYRSLSTELEQVFQDFEKAQEWSDLISSLSRLSKVLDKRFNSQCNLIPRNRQAHLIKILSQCLNRGLPAGVHLRAIEIFSHIFTQLNPHFLHRDLSLWVNPLFLLLPYASEHVKHKLLDFFTQFILTPLHTNALTSILPGLIASLLPALEDPTSDVYAPALRLINKFAAVVGVYPLLHCLWDMIKSVPQLRSPALTYMTMYLPKPSFDDENIVQGRVKYTQLAKERNQAQTPSQQPHSNSALNPRALPLQTDPYNAAQTTLNQDDDEFIVLPCREMPATLQLLVVDAITATLMDNSNIIAQRLALDLLNNNFPLHYPSHVIAKSLIFGPTAAQLALAHHTASTASPTPTQDQLTIGATLSQSQTDRFRQQAARLSVIDPGSHLKALTTDLEDDGQTALAAGPLPFSPSEPTNSNMNTPTHLSYSESDRTSDLKVSTPRVGNNHINTTTPNPFETPSFLKSHPKHLGHGHSDDDDDDDNDDDNGQFLTEESNPFMSNRRSLQRQEDQGRHQQSNFSINIEKIPDIIHDDMNPDVFPSKSQNPTPVNTSKPIHTAVSPPTLSTASTTSTTSKGLAEEVGASSPQPAALPHAHFDKSKPTPHSGNGGNLPTNTSQFPVKTTPTDGLAKSPSELISEGSLVVITDPNADTAAAGEHHITKLSAISTNLSPLSHIRLVTTLLQLLSSTDPSLFRRITQYLTPTVQDDQNLEDSHEPADGAEVKDPVVTTTSPTSTTSDGNVDEETLSSPAATKKAAKIITPYALDIIHHSILSILHRNVTAIHTIPGILIASTDQNIAKSNNSRRGVIYRKITSELIAELNDSNGDSGGIEMDNNGFGADDDAGDDDDDDDVGFQLKDINSVLKGFSADRNNTNALKNLSSLAKKAGVQIPKQRSKQQFNNPSTFQLSQSNLGFLAKILTQQHSTHRALPTTLTNLPIQNEKVKPAEHFSDIPLFYNGTVSYSHLVYPHEFTNLSYENVTVNDPLVFCAASTSLLTHLPVPYTILTSLYELAPIKHSSLLFSLQDLIVVYSYSLFLFSSLCSMVHAKCQGLSALQFLSQGTSSSFVSGNSSSQSSTQSKFIDHNTCTSTIIGFINGCVLHRPAITNVLFGNDLVFNSNSKHATGSLTFSSAFTRHPTTTLTVVAPPHIITRCFQVQMQSVLVLKQCHQWFAALMTQDQSKIATQANMFSYIMDSSSGLNFHQSIKFSPTDPLLTPSQSQHPAIQSLGLIGIHNPSSFLQPQMDSPTTALAEATQHSQLQNVTSIHIIWHNTLARVRHHLSHIVHHKQQYCFASQPNANSTLSSLTSQFIHHSTLLCDWAKIIIYFATFLPIPTPTYEDGPTSPGLTQLSHVPSQSNRNALLGDITSHSLHEQLHVSTTAVLLDAIVVLLELFLATKASPTTTTQANQDNTKTPSNHTRLMIPPSTPSNPSGNKAAIDNNDYLNAFYNHQDHQRYVLSTFSTLLDVTTKLIGDIIEKPILPSQTLIYGLEPDQTYAFVMSITRLLSHNIDFATPPVRPKSKASPTARSQSAPQDTSLGSFNILLPLPVQQSLLTLCCDLLGANSNYSLNIKVPKGLLESESVADPTSTAPPPIQQVKAHQHEILASLFSPRQPSKRTPKQSSKSQSISAPSPSHHHSPNQSGCAFRDIKHSAEEHASLVELQQHYYIRFVNRLYSSIEYYPLSLMSKIPLPDHYAEIDPKYAHIPNKLVLQKLYRNFSLIPLLLDLYMKYVNCASVTSVIVGCDGILSLLSYNSLLPQSVQTLIFSLQASKKSLNLLYSRNLLTKCQPRTRENVLAEMKKSALEEKRHEYMSSRRSVKDQLASGATNTPSHQRTSSTDSGVSGSTIRFHIDAGEIEDVEEDRRTSSKSSKDHSGSVSSLSLFETTHSNTDTLYQLDIISPLTYLPQLLHRVCSTLSSLDILRSIKHSQRQKQLQIHKDYQSTLTTPGKSPIPTPAPTGDEEAVDEASKVDVELDFNPTLLVLDDILSNLDFGMTEEISMRALISIVVNVLNICPSLFTAYVHSITSSSNGSSLMLPSTSSILFPHSGSGQLPESSLSGSDSADSRQSSSTSLSRAESTNNLQTQYNKNCNIANLTNSRFGPSPAVLEATLQRSVNDLFHSSIDILPSMQIVQLLTTVWNVLYSTSNRGTSDTSRDSPDSTVSWCVNNSAHCCDQQYPTKGEAFTGHNSNHVECLCDLPLHKLSREQSIYVTQCVIVNRLALSLFTYNTAISGNSGPSSSSSSQTQHDAPTTPTPDSTTPQTSMNVTEKFLSNSSTIQHQHQTKEFIRSWLHNIAMNTYQLDILATMLIHHLLPLLVDATPLLNKSLASTAQKELYKHVSPKIQAKLNKHQKYSSILTPRPTTTPRGSAKNKKKFGPCIPDNKLPTTREESDEDAAKRPVKPQHSSTDEDEVYNAHTGASLLQPDPQLTPDLQTPTLPSDDSTTSTTSVSSSPSTNSTSPTSPRSKSLTQGVDSQSFAMLSSGSQVASYSAQEYVITHYNMVLAAMNLTIYLLKEIPSFAERLNQVSILNNSSLYSSLSRILGHETMLPQNTFLGSHLALHDQATNASIHNHYDIIAHQTPQQQLSTNNIAPYNNNTLQSYSTLLTSATTPFYARYIPQTMCVALVMIFVNLIQTNTRSFYTRIAKIVPNDDHHTCPSLSSDSDDDEADHNPSQTSTQQLTIERTNLEFTMTANISTVHSLALSALFLIMSNFVELNTQPTIQVLIPTTAATNEATFRLFNPLKPQTAANNVPTSTTRPITSSSLLSRMSVPHIKTLNDYVAQTSSLLSFLPKLSFNSMFLAGSVDSEAQTGPQQKGNLFNTQGGITEEDLLHNTGTVYGTDILSLAYCEYLSSADKLYTPTFASSPETARSMFGTAQSANVNVEILQDNSNDLTLNAYKYIVPTCDLHTISLFDLILPVLLTQLKHTLIMYKQQYVNSLSDALSEAQSSTSTQQPQGGENDTFTASSVQNINIQSLIPQLLLCVHTSLQTNQVDSTTYFIQPYNISHVYKHTKIRYIPRTLYDISVTFIAAQSGSTWEASPASPPPQSPADPSEGRNSITHANIPHFPPTPKAPASKPTGSMNSRTFTSHSQPHLRSITEGLFVWETFLHNIYTLISLNTHGTQIQTSLLPQHRNMLSLYIGTIIASLPLARKTLSIISPLLLHILSGFLQLITLYIFSTLYQEHSMLFNYNALLLPLQQDNRLINTNPLIPDDPTSGGVIDPDSAADHKRCQDQRSYTYYGDLIPLQFPSYSPHVLPVLSASLSLAHAHLLSTSRLPTQSSAANPSSEESSMSTPAQSTQLYGESIQVEKGIHTRPQPTTLIIGQHISSNRISTITSILVIANYLIEGLYSVLAYTTFSYAALPVVSIKETKPMLTTAILQNIQNNTLASTNKVLQTKQTLNNDLLDQYPAPIALTLSALLPHHQTSTTAASFPFENCSDLAVSTSCPNHNCTSHSQYRHPFIQAPALSSLSSDFLQIWGNSNNIPSCKPISYATYTMLENLTVIFKSQQSIITTNQYGGDGASGSTSNSNQDQISQSLHLLWNYYRSISQPSYSGAQTSGSSAIRHNNTSVHHRYDFTLPHQHTNSIQQIPLGNNSPMDDPTAGSTSTTNNISILPETLTAALACTYDSSTLSLLGLDPSELHRHGDILAPILYTNTVDGKASVNLYGADLSEQRPTTPQGNSGLFGWFFTQQQTTPIADPLDIARGENIYTLTRFHCLQLSEVIVDVLSAIMMLPSIQLSPQEQQLLDLSVEQQSFEQQQQQHQHQHQQQQLTRQHHNSYKPQSSLQLGSINVEVFFPSTEIDQHNSTQSPSSGGSSGSNYNKSISFNLNSSYTSSPHAHIVQGYQNTINQTRFQSTSTLHSLAITFPRRFVYCLTQIWQRSLQQPTLAPILTHPIYPPAPTDPSPPCVLSSTAGGYNIFSTSSQQQLQQQQRAGNATGLNIPTGIDPSALTTRHTQINIAPFTYIPTPDHSVQLNRAVNGTLWSTLPYLPVTGSANTASSPTAAISTHGTSTLSPIQAIVLDISTKILNGESLFTCLFNHSLYITDNVHAMGKMYLFSKHGSTSSSSNSANLYPSSNLPTTDNNNIVMNLAEDGVFYHDIYYAALQKYKKQVEQDKDGTHVLTNEERDQANQYLIDCYKRLDFLKYTPSYRMTRTKTITTVTGGLNQGVVGRNVAQTPDRSFVQNGDNGIVMSMKLPPLSTTTIIPQASSSSSNTLIPIQLSTINVQQPRNDEIAILHLLDTLLHSYQPPNSYDYYYYTPYIGKTVDLLQTPQFGPITTIIRALPLVAATNNHSMKPTGVAGTTDNSQLTFSGQPQPQSQSASNTTSSQQQQPPQQLGSPQTPMTAGFVNIPSGADFTSNTGTNQQHQQHLNSNHFNSVNYLSHSNIGTASTFGLHPSAYIGQHVVQIIKHTTPPKTLDTFIFFDSLFSSSASSVGGTSSSMINLPAIIAPDITQPHTYIPTSFFHLQQQSSSSSNTQSLASTQGSSSSTILTPLQLLFSNSFSTPKSLRTLLALFPVYTSYYKAMLKLSSNSATINNYILPWTANGIELIVQRLHKRVLHVNNWLNDVDCITIHFERILQNNSLSSNATINSSTASGQPQPQQQQQHHPGLGQSKAQRPQTVNTTNSIISANLLDCVPDVDLKQIDLKVLLNITRQTLQALSYNITSIHDSLIPTHFASYYRLVSGSVPIAIFNPDVNLALHLTNPMTAPTANQLNFYNNPLLPSIYRSTDQAPLSTRHNIGKPSFPRKSTLPGPKDMNNSALTRVNTVADFHNYLQHAQHTTLQTVMNNNPTILDPNAPNAVNTMPPLFSLPSIDHLPCIYFSGSALVCELPPVLPLPPSILPSLTSLVYNNNTSLLSNLFWPIPYSPYLDMQRYQLGHPGPISTQSNSSTLPTITQPHPHGNRIGHNPTDQANVQLNHEPPLFPFLNHTEDNSSVLGASAAIAQGSLEAANATKYNSYFTLSSPHTSITSAQSYIDYQLQFINMSIYGPPSSSPSHSSINTAILYDTKPIKGFDNPQISPPPSQRHNNGYLIPSWNMVIKPPVNPIEEALRHYEQYDTQHGAPSDRTNAQKQPDYVYSIPKNALHTKQIPLIRASLISLRSLTVLLPSIIDSVFVTSTNDLRVDFGAIMRYDNLFKSLVTKGLLYSTSLYHNPLYYYVNPRAGGRKPEPIHITGDNSMEEWTYKQHLLHKQLVDSCLLNITSVGPISSRDVSNPTSIVLGGISRFGSPGPNAVVNTSPTTPQQRQPQSILNSAYALTTYINNNAAVISQEEGLMIDQLRDRAVAFLSPILTTVLSPILSQGHPIYTHHAATLSSLLSVLCSPRLTYTERSWRQLTLNHFFSSSFFVTSIQTLFNWLTIIARCYDGDRDTMIHNTKITSINEGYYPYGLNSLNGSSLVGNGIVQRDPGMPGSGSSNTASSSSTATGDLFIGGSIDKRLFTELLEKTLSTTASSAARSSITNPSWKIFSINALTMTKQQDLINRAQNIKRVAFLLLAGRHNQYSRFLPQIIDSIADGLRISRIVNDHTNSSSGWLGALYQSLTTTLLSTQPQSLTIYPAVIYLHTSICLLFRVLLVRMDVDTLSTIFGIIYTEIITIFQSIHAKSFDLKSSSASITAAYMDKGATDSANKKTKDDLFKSIRKGIDVHGIGYSNIASSSGKNDNVILPTHHNNVKTNELLYNNTIKQLPTQQLISEQHRILPSASIQSTEEATSTPEAKVPTSTSFFTKLKFGRSRTESKPIIDMNTAVHQAKQTTTINPSTNDIYINKTFLQLLLECCKILDYSILVIPDTFYHYKWMFVGLDWTSTAATLSLIPSYPHLHDFMADPTLTTRLYSELYNLDCSKPLSYQSLPGEAGLKPNFLRTNTIDYNNNKSALSFHPHLQSIYNHNIFINSPFFQHHGPLQTTLYQQLITEATSKLSSTNQTTPSPSKSTHSDPHAREIEDALGLQIIAEDQPEPPLPSPPSPAAAITPSTKQKQSSPILSLQALNTTQRQPQQVPTHGFNFLPLYNVFKNESMGYNNFQNPVLLQPLPFCHTSSIFNRPLIVYHKITNIKDLSPFFIAFLHLFHGDNTASTLFNVDYTSTFALDLIQNNPSLALHTNSFSINSRMSMSAQTQATTNSATLYNLSGQQSVSLPASSFSNSEVPQQPIPPILQRLAQTTSSNNVNKYATYLYNTSSITPFPLSLHNDELSHSQYGNNTPINGGFFAQYNPAEISGHQVNRPILFPGHLETLSTLFTSPDQQPSALYTKPNTFTNSNKDAGKKTNNQSKYDSQFLNTLLLQDFVEDIDHIS